MTCALCPATVDLVVDVCFDCQDVRGVLCPACADALMSHPRGRFTAAARATYVMAHVDASPRRKVHFGTQPLELQLGYPPPRHDFRRNPGPDPEWFKPTDFDLAEVWFVRWLYKTRRRWPQAGQPGHRSHRDLPNYYIHADTLDADSAEARRDILAQEGQNVAEVDGESMTDPRIREAFLDPDPRPVEKGGWGGGFSIVTRPAAPKAESDRPRAVAGRLLDDAFRRSRRAPVLVSELRELADDAGISWDTVARAGKARGIIPRRVAGTRGTSEWCLPDEPGTERKAKRGKGLPPPDIKGAA
jgi:hypothetical protein